MCAALARADEPASTVLIVRSKGDERIVVSLRAELVSYRFNVLEIAPRGGAAQPLASLAETYEAQAALRAQPEQLAVEVCVVANDSEAERASHDELVTIEAGERPELLATRVTEAMRARGLRLPAPSESARQPAVVAKPPEQPAAGERAPGAQPSAADAKPESPGVPEAPGADAAIKNPQRPGEAGTVKPVAGETPGKASQPGPNAAPKGQPEANATAKPPRDANAQPKPPPAPQAAEQKAGAQPPKARPPAPHVNRVVHRPAEQAEPAAAVEATTPRDSAAAVSGESPATWRDAMLFVELSPAGVFHLGGPQPGLGPSFDIWADLRLQPYPTASLSLFALVPLALAPVETPEGGANVHMYAIGGAADFHVPIDAFSLSLGMGAASLLTQIKGYNVIPSTSNPPNIAKDDPQRTMALFVRAGGAYPLASSLRLTARVLIGFAVPELQIRFLEKQVASSGHPLLVGTLGLELALPWQR